MIRERLKISDHLLRRWIARGLLHSDRLNNGGYALYSDTEVQRLVNRIADGSIQTTEPIEGLDDDGWDSTPKYSGDDVTRVFTLIGEGFTMVQIQVKTQLHPTVLRAIHKEFQHFERSILVPYSILAQMNRLTLPGNFPLQNATDIYEVMRSAAEAGMCPNCNEQPCASQCVVCLRKRFMDAMAQPAPTNGARADTRTVRTNVSDQGLSSPKSA